MNILLRTQYIVGAGLAYSGLALDPLMDMFKMLGRTAGHLQNVVGVSSKVIAGNDVRMLSYILHKGVIVAGVLQSHLDQGSDGIANPGIIGYDGVRFNDAQSLHFPNSLNDGGNRQMDSLADIRGLHPCIFF